MSNLKIESLPTLSDQVKTGPDGRSQLPPAQEAKVDRLGTTKVSSLILEFSIPSIIALIIFGAYNIIDSIFIGQAAGAAGLATATIAMPPMVMAIALSLLIGAGANALLALSLGEGHRRAAAKILGNSLLLCLIFAVLYTAVMLIFMDDILRLCGATDETIDMAREFTTVIVGGSVVMIIGSAFNNFIRTAGDPNRALITVISGVTVCIVLNYLFVIQFGWGVAGSAWATILGQTVTLLIVLHYFTLSNKPAFKLEWRRIRLNAHIIMRIVVLGSAAFVLQLCQVILTFVLTRFLVEYGSQSEVGVTGAEAGIGVVNRIITFAFFPVLGLAQAVQPIFGFNFGAKLIDRVRETFKITVIWVFIIGTFFWIILHLFPAEICSIFGITDPVLFAFTRKALIVQCLLLPAIGLQVVASQYFQSTGQPSKSMFLALSRQLIFLVPLLFLLPQMLPGLDLGITQLDSLYYAYPIADALSLAVSAILMYFEFKKLHKIKHGEVQLGELGVA